MDKFGLKLIGRIWVSIFVTLIVLFCSSLICPAIIVQREQDSLAEESASVEDLIRNCYDQGKAYYRQQKYSEAKKEFERILELDTDHRRASLYLQKIKEKKKKNEKVAKPKASNTKNTFMMRMND